MKADQQPTIAEHVRAYRRRIAAAGEQEVLFRLPNTTVALIEVSGNPEKPLMVQVVRFSDGEQLSEPRSVLDMGKLIELDRAETLAIKREATGRKNGKDQ